MNENQTPPAAVKIGGLSVTHGWASDLRALASQIIDRVMDGETRAYAIAEMIAQHFASMPPPPSPAALAARSVIAGDLFRQGRITRTECFRLEVDAACSRDTGPIRYEQNTEYADLVRAGVLPNGAGEPQPPNN